MIRVRVKELLEERGWSVARLARRADMDYKTVDRLVKDPTAEVTTVTLGRLADALDISIHDLVEDMPPKMPPSSTLSSPTDMPIKQP